VCDNPRSEISPQEGKKFGRQFQGGKNLARTPKRKDRTTSHGRKTKNGRLASPNHLHPSDHPVKRGGDSAAKEKKNLAGKPTRGRGIQPPIPVLKIWPGKKVFQGGNREEKGVHVRNKRSEKKEDF